LAEEVDQLASLVVWLFSRSPKLIDDTTEKHRLALSRIPLNPEQSALFILTPSPEVVMREDPLVRVRQEATLLPFDALLFVTRVDLVWSEQFVEEPIFRPFVLVNTIR
jgi:hypothetical protein